MVVFCAKGGIERKKRRRRVQSSGGVECSRVRLLTKVISKRGAVGDVVRQWLAVNAVPLDALPPPSLQLLCLAGLFHRRDGIVVLAQNLAHVAEVDGRRAAEHVDEDVADPNLVAGIHNRIQARRTIQVEAQELGEDARELVAFWDVAQPYRFLCSSSRDGRGEVVAEDLEVVCAHLTRLSCAVALTREGAVGKGERRARGERRLEVGINYRLGEASVDLRGGRGKQ